MPRYMLEQYIPGIHPGDLPREVSRINGAIAELRSKGVNVRHIRSILVPDDETCFHYLEATTEEVHALRDLAAVRGDRVSEAIE